MLSVISSGLDAVDRQWCAALPERELRELPKDGKTKAYEEFAKLFSLGLATTEKVNPLTETVSQKMQEDVSKGLDLLWQADQSVLKGFADFIPTIEKLAPLWAKRLSNGGRVFLNGSGSSGRLGLGLAARCQRVSKKFGEQVVGVMAGGDSAMIRAKEGYEDSEKEGEECLQGYKLTGNDISIQVSASGSAFFNVGCGRFAADQGADVYYFYNSKDILPRTQQLFQRDHNPVTPLLVDIGPQAITGSTRLQSATVAELCLGALLISALLHAEGREEEAKRYPQLLLEMTQKGNERIRKELPKIALFAQKEAELFLSPAANFFLPKDRAESAYITILAEKETLRIGEIDMTEINPTFQINPIRRASEAGKKRGEYQAYLVGESDNNEAWKHLVGRPVAEKDLTDTNEFLIAADAPGVYSYENRPKGKGNFVIGLSKRGTGLVADMLGKVLDQEGDTGMIVVSKDKSAAEVDPKTLLLNLDELPDDGYGLVEDLVMKQALNLISNSAMILVGKVRGNLMIDMRAANQKLIDRAMRIITEIWKQYKQKELPISEDELYYTVIRVEELKKKFDDRFIYTPSVVRTVLAMLHLEKKPTPQEFLEVIDFLAERREQLEFLTALEPFSLQLIDRKA